MKAINLLPPTFAARPRAPPRSRRRAGEPGGIGAFVVLGALALRRRARRVRPDEQHDQGPRRRSSTAVTAQAEGTTRSRQPAQALRRLRGDRRDAHPDRQGPRVLALRLGAGAARHLARHPGRRHAHRAQRHDLQRRRRRRRRPPQRDRRARDRDQGLHRRPEAGRHADGPPAQHRRRHPRQPHQVDQARQVATAGAVGADRRCAPTRPAARASARRSSRSSCSSRAPSPATVEDVTVQRRHRHRAERRAAPRPPGAAAGRRHHPPGRAESRGTATPASTPRGGCTSDPHEQDPAVGRRARRRPGRLLVPRPRAQARAGRQARRRDRDQAGRGRPGAATLATYEEAQEELQDATTRRSSVSARPSRPTTTSAR